MADTLLAELQCRGHGFGLEYDVGRDPGLTEHRVDQQARRVPVDAVQECRLYRCRGGNSAGRMSSMATQSLRHRVGKDAAPPR